MSEKESEKKPIYVTEFVNKRQQESAQIMFANGASGIFVPANSTFELETEDKLDMYARFSKIQFMRNGDIKTTVRSDWKKVEETLDYGSQFVCEFYNRDGSLWESVYLDNLGNRPVLIPKGVPRFLPLTIDSTYIKFKKFIWEFQLHKEKISGTNYFTETWGLRRYGIERDKKELKEIVELIKERDLGNAQKSAKQNVDAYLTLRGLKT
jgi:hypothetical protein